MNHCDKIGFVVLGMASAFASPAFAASKAKAIVPGKSIGSLSLNEYLNGLTDNSEK